MPRRIIKAVNKEFYHITKRGIQKIFLDREDCLRFINSLLVFNDENPTPWNSRVFWYKKSPDFLSKSNYMPKNPLVEIHVFTLMPNHFHLLIRQLVKNGIQILMQKLGGFSQYFNRKYGKQGILFQQPYKITHIDTEEQLKNTFTYIHTNQLSLIESGWKNWKVKNPDKALNFLKEKYRWSSLWDYLGKENFPKVITKQFFLKLLGSKKGIKKEIMSWIEFRNKIFKDKEKLRKIIFE